MDRLTRVKREASEQATAQGHWLGRYSLVQERHVAICVKCGMLVEIEEGRLSETQAVSRPCPCTMKEVA